ncbi:MAG: peptide chain release factor N(5)-glutamine methyltransferase [Gammaproteobacteria bacterium]|nr:MAG: peptide chain release factor N(5)-glutamine methyltransferase [Gammaproteobacteria bacterium]
MALPATNPAARPASSVSQLRADLRHRLTPVADDGAQLEADLLLMAAIGCKREQLLMAGDDPLTDDQSRRLETLVERRVEGEPMAYILGKREFWSLELSVTPATLIPRPETERLVEIALQAVTDQHASVADLGTGSGAIALALANERPHWQLVATDASQAALDVAIDNARALAVTNVEFRQGEWFMPLAGECFDLIISNPPYVADKDLCLQQGDTSQEPRTALAAGVDGLDDLRELIISAARFLLPGGQLLLEHGNDQRAELTRLLAAAGWQQIKCYEDLAGHDRCVLATRG